MTVKVWFVRDGPEPTRGGPAYELPLESCIEKIGLEEPHWFSGLDQTPRFGDQTSQLGETAGYRHVVCEIDEAQTGASGWKAGFYRADMSPTEAVERLGPPRKSRET
jgi:hypothetical protein